MPVFLDDGQLVGYTTIKGHYLDIGGKEPYSTDTVDIFQEGTIFPGVKLYRAGKLVPDIYRMLLANTRVPKMVAGDVNAEVIGVRTGAAALLRVIERVGLETFELSVERMYDHGEAIVRSYFEKIPDGRYVGEGVMDDDGISDDAGSVRARDRGRRLRHPRRLLTRAGRERRADQLPAAVDRVGDARRDRDARRRRRGAERGPLPADRGGDAARVDVPCALPDAVLPLRLADVPGDRDDLQRAREGDARRRAGVQRRRHRVARLVGQPRGRRRAVGRRVAASGRTGRLAARRRRERHHAPRRVGDPLLADRGLGVEEPVALEKVELREDSGGPGKHRGGLGLDLTSTCSRTRTSTAAIERTKNPPWGLEGGLEAVPNTASLVHPDGSRATFGKATRLLCAKGSTLELRTGGGGGYGDPSERAVEDVRADLREGYITEAHAREYYPHAFTE